MAVVPAFVSIAAAQGTPVFESDGTELAGATTSITALLAVGAAIVVGLAVYSLFRRGAKTAGRG